MAPKVLKFQLGLEQAAEPLHGTLHGGIDLRRCEAVRGDLRRQMPQALHVGIVVCLGGCQVWRGHIQAYCLPTAAITDRCPGAPNALKATTSDFSCKALGIVHQNIFREASWILSNSARRWQLASQNLGFWQQRNPRPSLFEALQTPVDSLALPRAALPQEK